VTAISIDLQYDGLTIDYQSNFKSMNFDNPDQLTTYLKEKSLLLPDEAATFRPLRGGVSCNTVWVQRTDKPDFVLKQARSRLEVQEDWFSDPARIHIEARGMQALQELTPPGSVPALLFEDADHHLLVMEAVPVPHKNWKTLLLQGQVDKDYFRQFGELLAGIHRRSFRRERYRRQFADRRFFETLRLEPYYAFTARQVPEAAAFLQQLIADCRRVELTLVHGDFSPKNILIQKDRLVLLDHEVMHYGDGAFDVGFSMTHFLSKACHVAGLKQDFLDAAGYYWNVYRDNFQVDRDWERRAVHHTIACMLARVRGKSPLEYLSDAERNRQQKLCLTMIEDPPSGILQLIHRMA
jgi:5-methylthioribose kinase